MAVLVNDRSVRLKGLFRTIAFFPATVTAVVVGLMWNWVYNPLYGVLDPTLAALGLGRFAGDWLGRPGTALVSVAIANSWQNTSLFFILFLAGLQQIDPALPDAAAIDGASSLQTFWYIVLPLLRRTTSIVIALGVIWSVRQFDLVWTMTQGGPGTATETLGTYIFRTAFKLNEMGYASALAVYLLLLTAAVTFAFLLWRERVSAV